MTHKKFTIIFESREVLNYKNQIYTKAGEKFWPVIEPDVWVEATSAAFVSKEIIPYNVKTWETKEQAEAFAERWNGHPWWCKPNGNYEIVELTPIMVTVQRGWCAT